MRASLVRENGLELLSLSSLRRFYWGEMKMRQKWGSRAVLLAGSASLLIGNSVADTLLSGDTAFVAQGTSMFSVGTCMRFEDSATGDFSKTGLFVSANGRLDWNSEGELKTSDLNVSGVFNQTAGKVVDLDDFYGIRIIQGVFNLSKGEVYSSRLDVSGDCEFNQSAEDLAQLIEEGLITINRRTVPSERFVISTEPGADRQTRYT